MTWKVYENTGVMFVNPRMFMEMRKTSLTGKSEVVRKADEKSLKEAREINRRFREGLDKEFLFLNK